MFVISFCSLNSILKSDAFNLTNTRVGSEDISTVGTSCTNAINNLKSSVSNGKASLASAITDKGVSTSATDSFSTMASNIRAISGGTLTVESSYISMSVDCTSFPWSTMDISSYKPANAIWKDAFQFDGMLTYVEGGKSKYASLPSSIGAGDGAEGKIHSSGSVIGYIGIYNDEAVQVMRGSGTSLTGNIGFYARYVYIS